MITDVDAHSEGSLRSSDKKPYAKRIVDGAQFRAAILALYNDQSTSDVTVDAAGKRWHVHGTILCAWSGIWREEYCRGQRAFRVTDVDADVVDDLLRYFYSGELLLTAHNAPVLLTLSHTLRADVLTRRLQEEEKSRTRSGTDGTPPPSPLTGSNSSLGAAVANAYGRPPLPSAPKPSLSPRPSSTRLPTSSSGGIAHSISASTQSISSTTLPLTSPMSAQSPPSPSPSPSPQGIPVAVLASQVKSKPQRPLPQQPRPANAPRASPFALPLASAQASASSTSVSSQIAAFNSASDGTPVAPTLSPRSRTAQLPSSPSSSSVAQKDKPTLPPGPKPPLSPWPYNGPAHTSPIQTESRIQHSSSPSLLVVQPNAGLPPPLNAAPPPPAPVSSSSSSPNLLPIVEKRTSPRREQETPPLQATPVPKPVAPTSPQQQAERRLSSAGMPPVHTVMTDEEAAKKAREKIKKMKKENEKAEKEQSKAKEDTAYKQQLEMMQRITLIENTHARIEFEAKEREKKERKEEEKKKAAIAAKRASSAPWLSASPAPRPASIRPVVED